MAARASATPRVLRSPARHLRPPGVGAYAPVAVILCFCEADMPCCPLPPPFTALSDAAAAMEAAGASLHGFSAG